MSKNTRKKAATKPGSIIKLLRRKLSDAVAILEVERNTRSRIQKELEAALCEAEARGKEIKRLESLDLDHDVKNEELQKTITFLRAKDQHIQQELGAFDQELRKFMGMATDAAARSEVRADGLLVIANDLKVAVAAEVEKSTAVIRGLVANRPQPEGSGSCDDASCQSQKFAEGNQSYSGSATTTAFRGL